MLSVVVALYQIEHLLPDFLASLAKLICDETQIEAVLVDDGSTDKTELMAREFTRQHTNARLIVHTENRGLFSTRQTGVQASTGRFIWLVDGDDVLLSLDLEFVVKSVVSHRDLDLFCFQYVETRSADIPKLVGNGVLKRYKSIAHGLILFPLLYWGNIWRFLIRRELLLKYYRTTNMRNDMGEDLVLTSWLGAETRAAMLADQPIYVYRRLRQGSYTETLPPFERMATSIGLFHALCVKNANNLDPATRTLLALFSLPMREIHRSESQRVHRPDMVAKCEAIDDIVPKIGATRTELAELIEQQSISLRPAAADLRARRILECLAKDKSEC
ncbi:MAG: glycosyltransferase [Alphaproteobacteria bacterium]|nr:glycosyltransferase [Alphaproteobacteria bacterium]